MTWHDHIWHTWNLVGRIMPIHLHPFTKNRVSSSSYCKSLLKQKEKETRPTQRSHFFGNTFPSILRVRRCEYSNCIQVQYSKQKNLLVELLLTATHILQTEHTVQTHLGFRHISAWKGFIIFFPHQSIHTTAQWQSKEHFGGEFYTVRKKVWNILLGIHIVYLILKAPFTAMTASDFLGQDLSRLTHLFTRFLPFFLAE